LISSIYYQSCLVDGVDHYATSNIISFPFSQSKLEYTQKASSVHVEKNNKKDQLESSSEGNRKGIIFFDKQKKASSVRFTSKVNY
jgi:hypothetical protein